MTIRGPIRDELKQTAALSRGAYLAFELAVIDRLKEFSGRCRLSQRSKQAGGDVVQLTYQL
jgi:hypothetical protein